MVKGAILIGHGFTPSKEDVDDTISAGGLLNCDTITTVMSPSEGQIEKDLAMATYVRFQMANNWELSVDVEIYTLKTKDGRYMTSVFPKY